MHFDDIVSKIDTKLSKTSGKYYSDFYIGITNNIERRLFCEHNVPKENHPWWIYMPAINDNHSRAVEKYYIDKGMRGGDGGGNNTAKYVYCYQIEHYTDE